MSRGANGPPMVAHHYFHVPIALCGRPGLIPGAVGVSLSPQNGEIASQFLREAVAFNVVPHGRAAPARTVQGLDGVPFLLICLSASAAWCSRADHSCMYLPLIDGVFVASTGASRGAFSMIARSSS